MEVRIRTIWEKRQPMQKWPRYGSSTVTLTVLKDQHSEKACWEKSSYGMTKLTGESYGPGSHQENVSALFLLPICIKCGMCLYGIKWEFLYLWDLAWFCIPPNIPQHLLFTYLHGYLWPFLLLQTRLRIKSCSRLQNDNIFLDAFCSKSTPDVIYEYFLAQIDPV